jgi:hypothetical protein
LEWNEFSDHVIELGLVRKDKTFKNVIKQYYPSQTLNDNEKHDNEIEKVQISQIRSIISETNLNHYWFWKKSLPNLKCTILTMGN